MPSDLLRLRVIGVNYALDTAGVVDRLRGLNARSRAFWTVKQVSFRAPPKLHRVGRRKQGRQCVGRVIVSS